MSGSIDYWQDGPLARVVLRNPGKLGAMSRPMWDQLRYIFNSISRSADARCVLFCGEDGGFCAGGDIAEYPAFRFDPVALRDFHEIDAWGGLNAMLACDVPIVVQIEGACMGAGVELASCCDIRIAAASARFGAPIGRLGFPMAPRELALLLREAGLLSVREMLLEAAVLDAPTLLARGFLNRVTTDAEVAEVALAAAQRIASLAPQAARLNKQLIRAFNPAPALAASAQDAIDLIVSGAYDYADSAEHREGVNAFLAKRKPVF